MNLHLIRPAFYFLHFIVLLFIAFSDAAAQEIPPVTVSGTYQNQPLQQIMADIEKRYPVRFFYQESWLSGIQKQATFDKEPIASAVEKLLSNTGVSFVMYD